MSWDAMDETTRYVVSISLTPLEMRAWRLSEHHSSRSLALELGCSRWTARDRLERARGKVAQAILDSSAGLQAVEGDAWGADFSGDLTKRVGNALGGRRGVAENGSQTALNGSQDKYSRRAHLQGLPVVGLGARRELLETDWVTMKLRRKPKTPGC